MKKINNILWQAKFEAQRNWLKAVKILKNALSEEADRIMRNLMLAQLAEIYVNQKLFIKAIDIYQQILASGNNNSDALFKLANCYLLFGKNEDSLLYYNRMDDVFPEIYYNKAIAYSRLGKIERSITELEKLMLLESTNIIPYYFAAEQMLQIGRYSDAEVLLKKMLSKFSSQGRLHYLLGVACTKQENWLRAYVEFTNSHQEGYESSNLYRQWGLACDKIGKTEKALDYLGISVHTDPANTMLYIDIINILIRERRYVDALEVAARAKEITKLKDYMQKIYDKIKALIDSSNANMWATEQAENDNSGD